MSGNMAFFFDLVALYLVALYLVALPGGPLPGGPLPGGPLPGGPLPGGPLPGCGLLCSFLILPSQNKMGQSFKIVVMIKKDSTKSM